MNHNWETKTQCSQCLGIQTPENANDDRCSGMVLNRHYRDFGRSADVSDPYDRLKGVLRRPDGGIVKESLVHGTYYYGRCRNASIARWDAVKQVFVHWRQKFGSVFLEEIHCREDELHFDVFDPWVELELSVGLNPIAISDKPKETTNEPF